MEKAREAQDTPSANDQPRIRLSPVSVTLTYCDNLGLLVALALHLSVTVHVTVWLTWKNMPKDSGHGCPYPFRSTIGLNCSLGEAEKKTI